MLAVAPIPVLKKTKKAVTLTEVIVGSVILALVFGGLLASFVGVRRYVRRANVRLVSANLARAALNNLYRAVREDEWNERASPLYPANHNNLSDAGVDLTNPIDNIQYTGNYQVTTRAGREYRQVRVNISYPSD